MNAFIKVIPKLIAVMFFLALPDFLAAQEYSDKGADNCLRCHRAAKWDVMPIFNTKHGSQVDPDAPFSNLQCEACHGPSAEHAKARKKAEVTPGIVFGKDSASTVSEQNAPCLSCHQNGSQLGWHGSAHESVDVACVSCHEIHVDRDPVFDPLEQQEICFECHQRVRADTYKTSGHGLRFGTMGCDGCHNVHDGFTERLMAKDTVNDTCYTCHAEKRGPFLWEHAPVSEDCTYCHEPHGSNHPALLTRRPPLLCQTCHSAADHPGDAYTSDDLGQTPKNRYMQSRACMNCHWQVHGSNHPSGSTQTR